MNAMHIMNKWIVDVRCTLPYNLEGIRKYIMKEILYEIFYNIAWLIELVGTYNY